MFEVIRTNFRGDTDLCSKPRGLMGCLEASSGLFAAPGQSRGYLCVVLGLLRAVLGPFSLSWFLKIRAPAPAAPVGPAPPAAPAAPAGPAAPGA